MLSCTGASFDRLLRFRRGHHVLPGNQEMPPALFGRSVCPAVIDSRHEFIIEPVEPACTFLAIDEFRTDCPSFTRKRAGMDGDGYSRVTDLGTTKGSSPDSFAIAR